ncbi:MAG: hypothetical protein ACRCY4_07425 [Brevinema sp.]
MKYRSQIFLLILLSLNVSFMFAQNSTNTNNVNATNQLSPREEKIRQEIEADNLPPLPGDPERGNRAADVPRELNINSEAVVRAQREVPNEGKPYFTISGGLAPFQASLGILKYFIAEWWGQAELGVYFFPQAPENNYFAAVARNDLSPFVGFKILTGYAFYNFRDFEMSFLINIGFSFINTTSIPIIFGTGFRFQYKFFLIDLGFLYSITTGGTPSPVFNGFQPIVMLGFRF